MFESKDEIKVLVGKLIDFTNELKKGDFIDLIEVEQELGIEAAINYGRFCYVIRKWSVYMSKKRHIEIHWYRQKGFKLCTDEDCATWLPAMRRSKAFRQHGKALRSFGNVSIEKLSPNMRLVVANGIEFSKQQRKELRKIKKQSVKACESNPRLALLPQQ